MGVTGLWSLIEDAGTRVDVQTLNQKVLAIDLSIWINQSIKGFRDRDGRNVENAHLLGLFYRICKLLFYQIKPIVVFDGECPPLKLHTVQKRMEKTRKTLQKSKNLSLNVLKNYINSQINFSQSTKLISKSNLDEKSLASQIYLPSINYNKEDIYQNFEESTKDESDLLLKDDESDIELKNRPYHHPLLQNIHDIDINSELFKNLPAITRYEILLELRESYKNRKSSNIELLPQESNTFSQFQMAKLLKKRNLQEEIEKLIKEFNNVQGENNIEYLKNTQNIDVLNAKPSTSTEITTGSLASDEQTRFLLLKTLNQAIEEFTVEEEEEIFTDENDDKQSPIYKVPNNLPGQFSIETDAERIELLSKCSDNSSQKFSSQNLSKKIDKNYKKFLKNDKNEEKLILSDTEDTDSTNSDDFIEIPIDDDEHSNDYLQEKEEFNESVPYDTNYQMDIYVEKPIDNVSVNKNEILNDNKMIEQSEQIVKSNMEEICEQENMETISNEIINNETTMITKNEQNIDKEQIIEIKPTTSSPVDIDQIIKDSKESTKLNRQANNVTNQMIHDCQQLLKLFGIPWVVAPGEAEAQCACLESLGLCEGIITDDSDVFLFGGQNIYRNFFTNSKFIKRYRLEDLKKYYGLDRCKFICLGMLCGTDYTFGVDGIGPVIGMEILSQFPGNSFEPLEKFSKWYREKINEKNVLPENSVRTKFLRFSLPNSFPSKIVFDAYQNANVDDSNEPFSWSMPQLSELRQFACERFGWSEAKTDAFLLPVLKNLNSKQTQKRIDFYFKPSHNNNSRISENLKIKRSKRLNEAIRKNIQLSMDSNCYQKGRRCSKKMKKTTNKLINKKKNKLSTATKLIEKKISSSNQIYDNNCQLSEESSSD